MLRVDSEMVRVYRCPVDIEPLPEPPALNGPPSCPRRPPPVEAEPSPAGPNANTFETRRFSMMMPGPRPLRIVRQQSANTSTRDCDLHFREAGFSTIKRKISKYILTSKDVS